MYPLWLQSPYFFITPKGFHREIWGIWREMWVHTTLLLVRQHPMWMVQSSGCRQSSVGTHSAQICSIPLPLFMPLSLSLSLSLSLLPSLAPSLFMTLYLSLFFLLSLPLDLCLSLFLVPSILPSLFMPLSCSFSPSLIISLSPFLSRSLPLSLSRSLLPWRVELSSVNSIEGD